MAGPDFATGEKRPQNVFSSLTGRVNCIRQGELFPERPAPGAVVCVYQGKTRFYAATDAKGIFRVNGLANKKLVLDKAVIEGFRFDPDTGSAVWAIDKKQTGKDNYRVKMSRNAMTATVWLAPFDFGIKESVAIAFTPDEETPGFMYLQLVIGTGIGPAARWVTIILFAEIAKRAYTELKQQEIFLLYYMFLLEEGKIFFVIGRIVPPKQDILPLLDLLFEHDLGRPGLVNGHEDFRINPKLGLR